MLTEEWQRFEFEYSCNIETDKYRTPIVYLQTGNGKKRTTYYITGFSVEDITPGGEPDTPREDPEVTDLTVDGKTVEGHTLTLSYEMSGDICGGLVKIMRSYKDGYVSVGSAFLDGEPVRYTPTESDAGGVIKFIAVPIDSENEPMKVKSVETDRITYSLNIEPEFVTDFESGSVSAEIEINNNDKERDITAVLAFFDKNNTMTDMCEKTVRSRLESIETIRLELTDNGAAKARIFVWEGGSAAETTMNSLIENVCMER